MGWLVFIGLCILAYWQDRRGKAHDAQFRALQERLDRIERALGSTPPRL